MGKKRLRSGFTTGSAAAAAAKAALLSLLLNRPCTGDVNIPRPEEGRLLIPVKKVVIAEDQAAATVVKDGGDDPDATHRARITSMVRLIPGAAPDLVVIKGGKGVGRVTKPGLPVPPGEPAINPGPRKQLKKAVQECFPETGAGPMAVEITIEVADGENIARRTLNPRLGIVGGISILGTRGTVIPFSHEAYEETISITLDMARAMGLNTIAFSTGGKSERFLYGLFPGLPEDAGIQVADFFAFALKEAAMRGFCRIIYGCFFGKLVKVAQGHEYTHAKTAMIDFCLLEEWCRMAGIVGSRAAAITGANTARHVLEMISDDKCLPDVIQLILHKALANGTRFIPQNALLEICVFTFDETLLGRASSWGRAAPKKTRGVGTEINDEES